MMENLILMVCYFLSALKAVRRYVVRIEEFEEGNISRYNHIAKHIMSLQVHTFSV